MTWTVPFPDPVDGPRTDTPAAVQTLREEQEPARRAAAGRSLDQPVPTRDQPISARRVYAHMIGGYARHNQHADLLRQAIDGVSGR